MNTVTAPAPVALAQKLMYAGAVVSFGADLLRVLRRGEIATALAKKLGDDPAAHAAVERVQHSGAGLIVAGALTATVWVVVAAWCGRGGSAPRIIATLLSLAVGVVAGLIVVLRWRGENSAWFARR